MLNRIINNQTLWLIVFSVLIIAVSWQSLTPKPINAFAYTSDKVLHFAGWLVLAITLLLSINKKILVASIILFTYSIIIECIQHWVPGRFFSGLDIVANGLGIIAAILIYKLIKKINWE